MRAEDMIAEVSNPQNGRTAELRSTGQAGDRYCPWRVRVRDLAGAEVADVTFPSYDAALAAARGELTD